MSMVACSPEEADNVTEEKMIIAVSIVPQKTFVKAVVGDNFSRHFSRGRGRCVHLHFRPQNR